MGPLPHFAPDAPYPLKRIRGPSLHVLVRRVAAAAVSHDSLTMGLCLRGAVWVVVALRPFLQTPGATRGWGVQPL